MQGETIGNFRVLERIGAGGMGEVWVAEQKDLGTRVAIKLLRVEISQEKEQVQRFFNEARAVSRIPHSGIVKISDAGYTTTGQAYMVMELLGGETLAKTIKRGSLALERLGEIGSQIASVLAATHDQGITHRDLKPDNIFLVPDAERDSGLRVKVLDFGIAKLSGTLAANSPQTHGAMGTPPYMAPEQWGNAADVDHRADFYSLGCVLFEMATGRPPFLGVHMADFCYKHLHAAPPKLRELRRDATPELEALIDKLLAKAPGERGDSLKPVREGLARLGRMEPERASSPAIALPPPEPGVASTIAPGTPTVLPPKLPALPPPHPLMPFVPVAPTAEMERREKPPEAPPRRRSKLPLVIAGLVLAAAAGIAIYFATRADKPAAAPPAAASCATVAEHMASLQPTTPKLRDVARQVMRSVIISRCTIDAWSPATIACLTKAASGAEIGACAEQLGSGAELVSADLEREAARLETDWVVRNGDKLELIDAIEFDGERVRDVSMPLVQAVRRFLADKEGLFVEVGAYVTDDTADLSTRRATNLRALLVPPGESGLQITAKGYGAHPPERIVLRLMTADERLAAQRTEPAKPGDKLTIVRFATGDATADAKVEIVLLPTIQWLQGHPNTAVGITGFTDNAEDPNLGERRAAAVAAKFLAAGIAPARIEARGEGATSPMAANSTPRGRAQNRRVEILLVTR